MFSGAFFKNQYSPIGLELGTCSIRMIQYRRGSRGVSLAGSGQYDLPAAAWEPGPQRDAEIVRGCRALLDRGTFHGAKVVSCLPERVTLYKNIRMPQMPAEELREAVKWEGAVILGLEKEPANIQCVVAGDVRQGEDVRSELILVAAREAEMDAHVKLLSEAGLEPVWVEAGLSALARMMCQMFRRQRDAESVRVLVDVGWFRSRVLIVRGWDVAFFKTMEIGSRSLNTAVCDHLKLSQEEGVQLRRRIVREIEDGGRDDGSAGSGRGQQVHRAVYEATRAVMGEMAREVALCVRYYSVTFRGSRPSEVYLSGGEAHNRDLLEAIGDQLDMPAAAAEPLRGIDVSGSELALERRGTLPHWAMASGLAGRIVEGKAAWRKGAA